MKKISEIAVIDAVKSAARQPASSADAVQIDERTAQVVNEIFRELQAIFPAWKQAWPDRQALDAARKTWIKGLAEAGVTDLDQVRFGLRQARKSSTDFIPNVGKFIAWCTPTPESLGLPSVEQAFDQALRGECRSGVVKAAVRLTGSYDLRCSNGSDTALKRRFESNYLEMVGRWRDGKSLDAPMLIGHDSQKSPAEQADEQAERELKKRIEQQGLVGIKGNQAIAMMRAALRGGRHA